jgi:hypothetical protein
MFLRSARGDTGVMKRKLDAEFESIEKMEESLTEKSFWLKTFAHSHKRKNPTFLYFFC